MRCEDREKFLPVYAEGGLSAEERDRVSFHLGRCPDCAGLAERLKRTDAALSSLEEVEPGPALMARLHDIPATAGKRRRFPSLSLKPVLQPVLAGAIPVAVLTAALVFTPAGGRLLKTISRQAHAGYSKVTQVYARVESLADSLGGAREKLVVTLETLPPLGGSRE